MQVTALWRRYGRAITAVITAALTAAMAYLSDNRISPDEGIQIAIATTSAAVVYLAPNLPHAGSIKVLLAAVLAALNLAVTLITGGLTMQEFANLLVVFTGAVFVGLAPSQSAGQVVTRP